MDDTSGKIFLRKEQIEYLVKLLEMPDPQEAIEKFAELLILEKADPSKMDKYVDELIKRGIK